MIERPLLAAISTLALAFLPGCAMGAAVHAPLHRAAPPKQSKSRPAGNEISETLSASILPARGGGVTVGGEIELGNCFVLGGACPKRVDVRNASLAVGYALVPSGHRPGFEATLLSGIGVPAGPFDPQGSRFRLTPDVELTLPLCQPDLRTGYIVLGWGVDAFVGVRAGLWSPASGSGASPALFESQVGLGLRARFFSDIFLRDGYPKPTKFP